MTLSPVAESRPSGPRQIELEYEPGVCNIGPAEIARRRRAGHLGLAATLVLLVVLVAVDAARLSASSSPCPPPALRPAIFRPDSGSAPRSAGGASSTSVRSGGRNRWPIGTPRRRTVAGRSEIGQGALAIGLTAGVAAVFLPL